jgi:hypothetical protein
VADEVKEPHVLRKVFLMELPDAIMLIVEHPSGVVYQNQVGGVGCWQAELEGVLTPVGLDPDSPRRLARDRATPDLRSILRRALRLRRYTRSADLAQ